MSSRYMKSEMNVAPMPFSLNQSSALCLPVVSDGRRLLWVHSDQISLQLDALAELEKAFDGFPYLTEKQTAALAQSCSLHPDQVKVWFMVQRLRYGISWDYNDILMVRSKFSSGRGKVKLHKSKGQRVKKETRENEKWKKEIQESDGRKAGEVREERRENERRMTGEDTRAAEEDNKKVQMHTQKRQKRVTETHERGHKRMKQDDEDVVERAGDKEMRSDENKETTLSIRKTKDQTRYHTKTVTQLMMMKMAFSHCQYPDREDYSRLTTKTGLTRNQLVQWFGDMRYSVKRAKPRWMNEEQHRQVLANIKYRQLCKTMAQTQRSGRGGNAARKVKRDGSESCGEDGDEQVSPEKKQPV